MRRAAFHMLLLVSACMLAACAGVQSLYFHALNHSLPVAGVQSVVYDQPSELSLDVYRAQGTHGPAPMVLFFYGGTWHDGERDYYRFVGEALSRHGVVVLVPDYRKAPAHPFPDFMVDAASAAAWAKAHATELGGDPARIHLMGHSAGAHMAALLATDPRYLARWRLRPRDFASVIGLSGPYDFLPIRERKVLRAFPDQSRWPETQPVNFVDGDEPPFLLLHGLSDRRVWRQNSEKLAALLKGAGEPVTLKLIPHTGHVAMVNGFRSPRFSPVLEETLAWINGGEAQAIASANPHAGAAGNANAAAPSPATPQHE